LSGDPARGTDHPLVARLATRPAEVLQLGREWTIGRIRAARAIALIADALQLGLFPLFSEGAASPLDAGLDVLVGVALTALLGWHWLFLPTFVAEAVPLLDVVPTWTAAVFYVTRQGARPPG
jgi:hypothetical protein